MKVEKHFATLVLCLVVLWTSRFALYSCGALGDHRVEAASSWLATAAAGGFLTLFMYPLAYDVVSFLTYRLGWEASFDHLEIYPGDPPAPNARPVSLKTKLLLFYPLDLAAVIFFLLPWWTKVAYCG
ncbi:hypothetical protein [Bradyrhizobium valentinum]|uniref:Uncharacterized protein n=1 Tax=Bradyrhizobium valentinum TaxID=1518501 RepID=A0A0R3LY97_9BRAD|nr:hypothetical protein [Bradyrhizobium valentinum]KRR10208.1 hypothetical protein CQ10_12380 [Bradyrhizobium valentinum]KRR12964.1 hypothetical protein CP49_31585 [Bradyrhizobium valentinum]